MKSCSVSYGAPWLFVSALELFQERGTESHSHVNNACGSRQLRMQIVLHFITPATRSLELGRPKLWRLGTTSKTKRSWRSRLGFGFGVLTTSTMRRVKFIQCIGVARRELGMQKQSMRADFICRAFTCRKQEISMIIRLSNHVKWKQPKERRGAEVKNDTVVSFIPTRNHTD